MIYIDTYEQEVQVITYDTGEVVVTTEDVGFATKASQAQVDAGDDDERFVTSKTLQEKNDTAVALVDGATIDITGPKHTLTTATGRTFTISHAGDDIVLVITLSATSATFTFPAAALCVADWVASGNNNLVITGAVSGDKHFVYIKKMGSSYFVFSTNFTQ